MNTLELPVKRPLKQYGPQDWAEWKSEAYVIERMVKGSGIGTKVISLEIAADEAVLSKAQSGMARLNERSMSALMDSTGSEAWLHYWLLKRNYNPLALQRMESDLERENRLLRERLAVIEAEREVELRLYSKLRAA